MSIKPFSSKKNRSKKSSFLTKLRKPIKKHGFLVLNALLIASVGTFLIYGRGNKRGSVVAQSTQATTETSTVAVLDQISSADIAVNIAQAARLPEVDQVRNQADTRDTLISIPVSNDVVVAKPQIITDATSGTQSRKDIAEYTVVDGETVTSIAQKYNLSAESVKWSNGITSDAVAAGTKLVLPPKNRTGLVYKPNAGDTIDKLAEKYKTTTDKIIAFNDLELTKSLPTNEYIFIPDGEKPPEPKQTIISSSSNVAFYGSFTPRFGGNGYASGYCTWWAAERRAELGRPVPSNLGNAITWLAAAQAAGFDTGTEPRQGAVIWYRFPATSAGHVAIVESVNADGSINISGMNDRDGWGRVSYYSIPASDLDKLRFIY
jgi:surface antigen